jgi:MFS family permease
VRDRTRWAAAAPFLIVGMIFASFFVRVPSLKIGHELTTGQLGMLLVLPTVAAVVTMQLTGGLVARFGSSPIIRLTAVGLPITLLGIGLAADPVQLAVALTLFGAVDGLLDVAMNSHAIAVERERGRPVMNSCHAAWSIGALVGSGLGGLTIQAGMPVVAHYLLVVAALTAIAVAAGPSLLPAAADRSDERAQGGRARIGWRTGWTPRVVFFGAVGAVVLLCEGAVGNWSGVFLHEDRGAPLATAALGYIGFTVCQAAGRLVGDRLHERYSAPVLVRCSGVVAVAALAVVVLSPQPALVIAGFTLLGVGLSVLLPVVFSAVGHSGANSDTASAAAALSKFTTLTYSGLLAGPMLIGWLAEAFGLTATLAGLLVLMVGVTLSAPALAVADRRAVRTENPEKA